MRGSTITFQQDNTYTRFNQWGNYRSLGLSLRYSFQAGKKSGSKPSTAANRITEEEEDFNFPTKITANRHSYS